MKAGEQISCANCGHRLHENDVYCPHCGQKRRDHLNRSIFTLAKEFFSMIFYLDNRLFISIRYLLLYPAKMPIEFIEGKRKKFISPITLFLFINLIFFLLSPVSDFSLNLVDQISLQPYSDYAKSLVVEKLQAEELTFRDFSEKYDRTSFNLSKSLMILNVPIIAFFLYLVSFKKRRFYFDSFLFSLHFFSFFLLATCILHIVDSGLSLVVSEAVDDIIGIVVLGIIISNILYQTFWGLHRFLKHSIAWTVVSGIIFIAALLFSNLCYRAITFFITFWLL